MNLDVAGCIVKAETVIARHRQELPAVLDVESSTWFAGSAAGDDGNP
jgi:hypothetical protein